MSIKRWLKDRQHQPALRVALDLTQSVYGAVLNARTRRSAIDVPAAAGGWPLRIVPMPAPRPITGIERRAVQRATRSSSATFFDGDTTREFEAQLASRWGAQHALATSSGTAALHTALMALDIGPGDEVIVPVMTYVATALAVLQAGAVPRFVDAHPETWNIDPEGVRAVINKRTRAIIPVHIGGVPCNMDELRAIADEHNLAIVEDAAHAHGSTLDGRFMGTLGELGCFSFGPPKSITTGEGGALLTSDPELYERAHMAMNLGARTPNHMRSKGIDHESPETRLNYEMVGWNYRMSGSQAALGLGQLARFDAIRARRIANGAYLREALADVPYVHVQRVPENAEVCYYSFPMSLDRNAPLSRGELLEGLAREKIDFRLWSNLPLASYDIFDQTGEFPVAQRITEGFVGLRVDPVLGRREMGTTVHAIRRLIHWAEQSR